MMKEKRVCVWTLAGHSSDMVFLFPRNSCFRSWDGIPLLMGISLCREWAFPIGWTGNAMYFSKTNIFITARTHTKTRRRITSWKHAPTAFDWEFLPSREEDKAFFAAVEVIPKHSPNTPLPPSTKAAGWFSLFSRRKVDSEAIDVCSGGLKQFCAYIFWY